MGWRAAPERIMLRGAEISVSDFCNVHLWRPLALAMGEQAVLEVLMDTRVHLVQSTGWEEKSLRDRVAHDDEGDSEPDIIDGVGAETGHVIRTSIGGRNGQPKQGTGEIVAVKKVLQDKRYKNRELQIMQMLEHPNIVALKHSFFSTTDKEEVYLNLVLEFVPESVNRIARQYTRMNQRMPLIYVKLYTYEICRALAYIHNCIGICHRDIKPQNLRVNPHTHQLKLCDFGSAKVLVKGETQCVVYLFEILSCP